MTDREMLLHLIGKLGLGPAPTPGTPSHDTYWENEAIVAIGAGEDGYSGLYAEFHFDAHGNLTSHAILE